MKEEISSKQITSLLDKHLKEVEYTVSHEPENFSYKIKISCPNIITTKLSTRFGFYDDSPLCVIESTIKEIIFSTKKYLIHKASQKLKENKIESSGLFVEVPVGIDFFNGIINDSDLFYSLYKDTPVILGPNNTPSIREIERLYQEQLNLYTGKIYNAYTNTWSWL